MSKKTIMALAVLTIFFVLISLFNTFAYDEENSKLEDSKADINLVYSIKDKGVMEVNVLSGETKYFDITLNNIYSTTVKYGMYYKLLSDNNSDFQVSLSEQSTNELKGKINPEETKVVSLKIVNNSNEQLNIELGALVGFENGNINDLVTNEIVLIK